MAHTKYRKVFCRKAIAYMAQGKSLNQLAHHLGVVPSTITAWEEKHDDFREAMERARNAAMVFWEGKLEDWVDEPAASVNTPLIKMLFAHRFRYYDSRPREEPIQSAGPAGANPGVQRFSIVIENPGGTFVPNQDQEATNYQNATELEVE